MAEDRRLRREAMLQYGPLLAPALRFSFDRPDERPEHTLPQKEKKKQAHTTK